ncbi:MAG: ADP-ribosylglycohydrolase family protein [Erysipelotrichaceae bacterium]|nr:ADP-ribosylglycohydrolase family protein [Erysipelotrichaceae bacterium]
MDFKTYYKKTYDAWLGKIVGIRLGSPIEAWEYEDILKTYNEINDYPVDYGIFAADDDSNGPRFFVEALNDDASDNHLENMANSILNYVRQGDGFFWWGGIGVSTEHTAYDNLMKNMSYLKSGKASVNGDELSQQIGGQIFSDCWGYVSMGDASLASKLAYDMASITHDKEALEGAKFIAAAIANAYVKDNVYEVLKESKKYVDNNSEYYKTIEDIENYYVNNKDYKSCIKYIVENYAYEKYGGICPIISNAALIIMSLLYGENDFDKTMCILATAGWDTDCNLGNVGSIMGALKGVSEKWARPINDLIIFSSSMGSLNIDTITNTAYRFVQIGYKLINKHIDDLKSDKFIFSTQAFNTRSNRYSETNLKSEDEKLKVIINNGYEGYSDEIYKKSYYLPNEIYDFRYEPVLSPTVYPNETITFKISNPLDLNISFNIYVKDVKGNYYIGEAFNVDKQIKDFSYKIPKGDFTVSEYGIKVLYKNKIIRSYFLIHEVHVSKDYDYEINFSKEENYDYGLDFMSVRQYGISQIVKSYGNSYIDNGLIINNGMVIFSDAKASVETIKLEFVANNDIDFTLCFNVKGINRYEGVRVKKDSLYYVENINRNINETLISKINLIADQNNEKLILNINVKYGKIVLFKTSIEELKFTPKNTYGAIGIINHINSELKVLSCKLKAIQEKV